MDTNNTNPHGGIFFEDNTEDLNSGNNSARISPKKVLSFFLIAVLVMGASTYFGFSFIKNNLTFGNKSQDDTKDRLTYNFAPESIGKYEPVLETLPEVEEKEEETVKEEIEETPEENTEIIVPVIEEDVILEEESTEPSLKERRLTAGINTTEVVTKKEEEKIIPSRQVKLLREIDYTLIKGTKIPCIMETNIISEQDGFTSCVVSQDVYGGNARILLIEKGTIVTGEYRGRVKNGDRRLQIIWDRLITPYDVVVQLKSPSTDRLGASGVTGKVDNRWRLRIGSALLVSLISDSLEIAGKRNESAQVIVDSKSAETTNNIAEKILEKNIDLPPIIFIREGEKINIYVADDIDLSPVYNVR